MTLKVLSFADFKERKPVVKFRSKAFWMNEHYFIEIERCDTPEKLIEWIRHLCYKSWVTTAHIQDLIMLAEKHAGIKIAYGC